MRIARESGSHVPLVPGESLGSKLQPHEPSMYVYSVDNPGLPPFPMPDRFRTEIVYFMTPPGDHGVPPLPPDEYWIRREDAKRWLDEFVVCVVSPLDAEVKAEIELSEDQEGWLEWMVRNEIEHVRLER